MLSSLFYFISNGDYLIILLLYLFINYYFYKIISHFKKPIILTMGIVVNLIILFYFKYSSFMVENISLILGIDFKTPAQKELPVGISFFCFMCISFLVEGYTKKNSEISLMKFSSYILCFPHLVAGPIIRYSEISSSLSQKVAIDKSRLRESAIIFTKGFAMKVVIADTLAPIVDVIFEENFVDTKLNFILAWVGAISYSLQIFFDFAGYSLMAIGLGKLIGFDFPANFDKPYQAKNMNDFWKKWHITLTRWMKDYLYVPLGGNRYGRTRTYLNIMIVFGLSGLWHGASWNYVMWGFYNGLIVIAERLINIEKIHSPKIIRMVTTLLIIIGWVIFRCTNVNSLLGYLKKMFDLNSIGRYNLSDIEIFVSKFELIAIFLIFLITFFGGKRIAIINKLPKNSRTLTFIYLFLFGISSIVILFRSYQPFIYFRF